MSRGEAAVEEYFKELRRQVELRRKLEDEALKCEGEQRQINQVRRVKNLAMRRLLLLFKDSRAARMVEACKVKDDEVKKKWMLSLSSLTFVSQCNVKSFEPSLAQSVSTTTSHIVAPVVAPSVPATLLVATSATATFFATFAPTATPTVATPAIIPPAVAKTAPATSIDLVASSVSFTSVATSAPTDFLSLLIIANHC